MASAPRIPRVPVVFDPHPTPPRHLRPVDAGCALRRMLQKTNNLQLAVGDQTVQSTSGTDSQRFALVTKDNIHTTPTNIGNTNTPPPIMADYHIVTY